MSDRNVKFVCLTDIEEKFNMSEFCIIHYIMQACLILKIRCFGGGIYSLNILDRKEDETELQQLYRESILRNFSVKDQIILYKRISEDNNFVNYNIMAFNGSGIEDIDKLLRVYKLKVFT